MKTLEGEMLESTIGVARIGTTKWIETQEWINIEFSVGFSVVSNRVPNPFTNHGCNALKKAFGLK